MYRKIEISHRTIVFTGVFVLSLWFLFLIRDLLFELFIALLLMAILNPMVTRLTKARVGRPLGVLLVYVLVLGLFGLVVGSVVPPLLDQTAAFASGLPGYLSNIGVTPIFSEEIAKEVLLAVGSVPSQIIRVGVSIFSNVLAVITILMFTFYLLLAREKLDEQLTIFLGEERKREVGDLIDILEDRLGGWARGQISLMFLVGGATFLGASLLGIPYALSLSLLAGLLEVIPYLGPWIAAVPLVIIGFGISPFMGVAAASLAFLIQQLENYLFVPKVMEKSVGVSPIVTLIALAVGARIAGIIGIMISIPAVITISVLTSHFLLKEKGK